MKEFWYTIQAIFTAIGGWLGYSLGRLFSFVRSAGRVLKMPMSFRVQLVLISRQDLLIYVCGGMFSVKVKARLIEK